jgi:hypothetical protein
MFYSDSYFKVMRMNAHLFLQTSDKHFSIQKNPSHPPLSLSLSLSFSLSLPLSLSLSLCRRVLVKAFVFIQVATCNFNPSPPNFKSLLGLLFSFILSLFVLLSVYLSVLSSSTFERCSFVSMEQVVFVWYFFSSQKLFLILFARFPSQLKSGATTKVWNLSKMFCWKCCLRPLFFRENFTFFLLKMLPFSIIPHLIINLEYSDQPF